MSWANIEPFRGIQKPVAARHGVMLSAPRFGGRYRPALWIVIRVQVWASAPPPWLAVGQSVTVQVGTGLNAGQLRLIPGSAFHVGNMTGPNKDALRVAVPVLPHQEMAKHQATPCAFTANDDWLAITLPSWCRPRAAVVQPALSPDAVARLRNSAAGRAA